MEKVLKSFLEMTTVEWYQIVKERIAVFVVEQNCPYQEVDEIDLRAYHHYYQDENGEIMAYNRLYQGADGIYIGRVLVAEKYRRQGLAEQLMEETLAIAAAKFPDEAVLLNGQVYLQAFYEKLGFVAISEVFLEDDIPHIKMQLVKNPIKD
ncbi:ElaA protein [Enterococcus sp. PF1-24]|uniref:GNAT family N-acetyltransferase n=1 Tax=unclassified Enterococcus TaxID=2608891 RepID=UPI0024770DFD|nr:MULTISPECIES: GNAT family N-acetyltransferase [unclassified Enterococcus]MDH6364827.1 ElaA protein [Enterococcus sp. PFB1-1]MDH6401949.1 ElaA protein [Enterococcus sp. PF1-24]